MYLATLKRLQQPSRVLSNLRVPFATHWCRVRQRFFIGSAFRFFGALKFPRFHAAHVLFLFLCPLSRLPFSLSLFRSSPYLFPLLIPLAASLFRLPFLLSAPLSLVSFSLPLLSLSSSHSLSSFCFSFSSSPLSFSSLLVFLPSSLIFPYFLTPNSPFPFLHSRCTDRPPPPDPFAYLRAHLRVSISICTVYHDLLRLILPSWIRFFFLS